MATTSNHLSEPSGGVFATTRWSVVLAARDGNSSDAFAALEGLCRAYWRPVYAYIRRDGSSPVDAQDLTQEFFRRFIEKDWIDHLKHQRGKFRSFLLTFLKHFLSDERDKAGAQKRGGGQTIISLDELRAEDGPGFELPDSLTPEEVFERRWAVSLLERVVARLRQEYCDSGKAALFDQLNVLQPSERGEANYQEIGARLGLSEAAVKSAVHRLRLRYRAILREEVARTIGPVENVDEEIRHLIQSLG